MQLKLRIVAFSYLVFVIYGSLVPLQYVGLEFADAWQKFLAIPFLELGVTSRADWVANGLLFIPLTFLAMSSFWRDGKKKSNILLSILILLVAAILSSSIEFTQLFFPQRTVSQNDILAEAIGGIVGVLLWWRLNSYFLAFVEQWFSENLEGKWQLYLTLYLICMLVYSVMPLDLTLSPVEIYHKWDDGRLVIIPFSFISKPFVIILYELLTDIALWIPVTILWLKTKPLTSLQVFIRVILAASCIELAQVFVFSRYTDINDILTAALGAYLGIILSKRYSLLIDQPEKKRQLMKNNSFLLGAGFYLLWSTILLVLYCYPYNLTISNEYITKQLSYFFSVPFSSYYYGSEYRALTQLFRKIIFAIPLGLSLAMAFSHRKVINKSIKVSLVLMLLFLTLFFIELFQMLIPTKTANMTDVFIGFFGGAFGYFGLNKLLKLNFVIDNTNAVSDNKRLDFNYTPIKTSTSRAEINARYSLTINRSAFCFLVIKVLVMFSLLIYAAQSSFIPYNIKEIYSVPNIYVGAFSFLVLLFFSLGFPLAVVQWQVIINNISLKRISVLITAHITITWILVRLLIPTESIHDIIGFPTWGMLHEFEMFFRFFGLFSLFSMTLFSVSIMKASQVSKSNYQLSQLMKVSWTIFLLVILPINFIVIIVFAGTDNLIELLNNDGYSIRSMALIVYFIGMAFSGVYLSFAVLSKSVLQIFHTSIIIIIISFISFYLVDYGTEQYIFKYDKTFSALQFLLSPNRDHYIKPIEIPLRFFIAHISLVFVLVLTQWHIFKSFKE
jgi:glycopeptide antibiotics resistance protein